MKRILFLIPLLLLFHSTQAQTWTQVFGPRGGSVRALTSDAGHVYAGTDSGVFVSSNNGTTWDQDTIGLTALRVSALAVTQSGTVLAGTNGGGVFRSSDHGAHWSSSNAGLTGATRILSLATDRSGNVFAGDSVHGVLYSTDDGQHWISSCIGMPDSTVWSLAVTPSGMLYAGTTGYILFSTNLGADWTVSKATPLDKIFGLLATPTNSVYAGTYQGMIYSSNAGSTSWSSTQPSTLGVHFQGMAIANQVLYAASTGFGQGLGVFFSADGTHWYSNMTGLDADPSIYSLTVTPSGDLFAGSVSGYIFELPGSGNSVFRAGTQDFSLEAYPNPFASSFTMHLSLPEGEHVELSLYNLVGERVERLFSGWLAAGQEDVIGTGIPLPEGMYFLRLTSSSGVSAVPVVRVH